MTTQPAIVLEKEEEGKAVPALELSHVSKSFSGKTVLSDVDLTIERGEIHALLGQNGSGKSTLIKILSGFHQPDPGGRVSVAGEPLSLGSSSASRQSGCRFVHQDLGLIVEDTVLNNLAIGVGFPTRWGTIRSRQALRQAERALSRVGLDISPKTQVSALSPAQRTGVAIARALDNSAGERPDLLVLDEPTASLPVDEVRHLLEILRSTAASGVGILYVTHHLDEVFALARTVSVLRDGQLVGTRQVASVDKDTLVHMLLGAELENAEHIDHDVVHLSDSDAPPVLTVKDLSAGPLSDVSFEARAGEIIGVHGLTGSGRRRCSVRSSEPCRAPPAMWPWAACRSPQTTRVAPSSRASATCLPTVGTRGGLMALTARENLSMVDLTTFWNRLRVDTTAERAEVAEWFAKLDVRPVGGLELPLSSFSGGNQQKILLAKWLRTSPSVLLLDDPTQGVDIGAKVEIHQQILIAAAAGAAVVISSTDQDD
ncbi:sugar ABC transporter ATP-binding protein [Aeromicrobium sp. UC242_57]|uniref:sugar ABC transporter ATP-binding protein n=1 Tax=Aeromicrobium sp. UC242_57 TaxID=3374624 RepID=UPI0037B3371E